MILVPALLFGLLAGWLKSRMDRSPWQFSEFQYPWLVAIFFIPQLLAFYLPVTRGQMPTALAAAYLVLSQTGLILFCLLNKHLPGMPVLAVGLLLNLLVISVNGGFMPLGLDTAAHLIPEPVLSNLKIGERFSLGSKDILLLPGDIIFPWLSDRFLSPTWLPYRFAFSLGDILIDVGAFLLLAFPANPAKFHQKKVKNHVNQPTI